ncbi:30S ribosomal protein S18 [Candidatus Peregrinibacteria bacterium]|nr:30S ribosomal protein S18 [Candidatus Peregrinibacteria bacterium]MBT4056206.1 30S ribosomal protein S18 [Candidatus Peregrinibacteria bacterium]
MPTYKHRQCKLCKEDANHVDYKNVPSLIRFLTRYGKIVPRYYSGSCIKHQKMISKAVKNARVMALIPFVR